MNITRNIYTFFPAEAASVPFGKRSLLVLAFGALHKRAFAATDRALRFILDNDPNAESDPQTLRAVYDYVSSFSHGTLAKIDPEQPGDYSVIMASPRFTSDGADPREYFTARVLLRVNTASRPDLDFCFTATFKPHRGFFEIMDVKYFGGSFRRAFVTMPRELFTEKMNRAVELSEVYFQIEAAYRALRPMYDQLNALNCSSSVLSAAWPEAIEFAKEEYPAMAPIDPPKRLSKTFHQARAIVQQHRDALTRFLTLTAF